MKRFTCVQAPLTLTVLVDEENQLMIARIEPDELLGSGWESIDDILDFARASEIAWRDVQKTSGTFLQGLIGDQPPFFMDYETCQLPFGNYFLRMTRSECMPPNKTVNGVSHKVVVEVLDGSASVASISMRGAIGDGRACAHQLIIDDPRGLF